MSAANSAGEAPEQAPDTAQGATLSELVSAYLRVLANERGVLYTLCAPISENSPALRLTCARTWARIIHPIASNTPIFVNIWACL